MKNSILIGVLLLTFLTESICQSSNIVVSGGWATVQPDDTEKMVNGFKVGGLYEFVINDHWAFGSSFSFLSFKEEGVKVDTILVATNSYQSWPFLINAKYLIGQGKVQGYINGTAGLQISTLKRESQTANLKDHDVGLALGTGVGLNITLSEKLFLQTEYEFLYQTNSFYKNGTINQVTLGLGIKL